MFLTHVVFIHFHLCFAFLCEGRNLKFFHDCRTLNIVVIQDLKKIEKSHSSDYLSFFKFEKVRLDGAVNRAHAVKCPWLAGCGERMIFQSCAVIHRTLLSCC